MDEKKIYIYVSKICYYNICLLEKERADSLLNSIIVLGGVVRHVNRAASVQVLRFGVKLLRCGGKGKWILP